MNQNDNPDLPLIDGVDFRDPSLLRQALTHSSYVNEQDGASRDNERMEFLGDAVLGFVAADLLYRRFPKLDEGELTQLRSALVRKQSLARLASDLTLGESLRVGNSEELTGGRQRATMLCNAFEALVGAIYLDQGMRAVHRFLKPRLLHLLDEVIANRSHIDIRSALHELAQKQLGKTPEYRLAGETGPDHQRVFTVELWIGGRKIAAGSGPSKQSAAQSAAQIALSQIESEAPKPGKNQRRRRRRRKQRSQTR